VHGQGCFRRIIFIGRGIEDKEGITKAMTAQNGGTEPRLTDAPRRTLLTSAAGLEQAKQLVTAYKTGKVRDMTPELWTAKKTIDSTIHPDTGEPVLLPFRMSSFVLSNLIVTGGMLTPGLGVWRCLHEYPGGE
jgi:hypothetical protein